VVVIHAARSSSARFQIGRRLGDRARLERRPFALAELTRNADIKLNDRVSLRARQNDCVVIVSDIALRPDISGKSRQAIILRLATLFHQVAHMMTDSHDIDHLIPRRSMPAWAEVWHLWTVIFPRRSITGRLLYGKVWRRHDGRRWIYKRFVEYRYEHPK